MALPLPVFIDRDPDVIAADMTAYYQDLVGKELEPAQIEQLLINSWAYRETLIRNDVQNASMQNLVAFARFPVLDYLGELVGVVRLPAAPALAVIDFLLSAGHTGVVIPAGIRIQSADGKVVFQTIEPITVAPGILNIKGDAYAQTAGMTGNGYGIGAINNILDPQPYLEAAGNIEPTAGGADEETDEQLRGRIKLAPSSFSNAGSEGAYRFWARSAHPSIVDVGILSGTPGTVEVYPLSNMGVPTPSGVLNAVEAVLTAEKVRPLSDTVVVASPTAIPYVLVVELTLLTDSDQLATEALARDSAEIYTKAKGASLGQDIVISQIIGAIQDDGIYKVNVVSPSVDISVNNNEVAQCSSILITTVAIQDA